MNAILDHQVPSGLFSGGRPPGFDQELKAHRIFNWHPAGREARSRATSQHQQIVHPSTKSERLARCILDRTERAIRDEVKMGPALMEAFDMAVAAATDFARDHPIYAVLLAIGTLVLVLISSLHSLLARPRLYPSSTQSAPPFELGREIDKWPRHRTASEAQRGHHQQSNASDAFEARNDQPTVSEEEHRRSERQIDA